MKSTVVDFGQPLPWKDLELSFDHARRCDLFVVAGSSLVVTPAADIPTEALRAGARLVILNRGDTPLDRKAYLRFWEPLGDILPRTVERLKNLMGRLE